MLSYAKAIYEDILKQRPNHFDALHFLGMIAYWTKNIHQAEQLFSRAIKVNPNNSAAYYNRGLALQDSKRLDEAIASYDKAIALRPDHATAYNNRGNALRDRRRVDEAIASFGKAIALKPDYADAYNNRGLAFLALKRLDEAIASYDKAIALRPDHAAAYNNRGKALRPLKRFDEAIASYDKGIALRPDFADGEADRLHTKMQLCDWGDFNTECEHLILSVRNKNVTRPPVPFIFVTIPSSSGEQLQCAKLNIAHHIPPSHAPIWQGERYNHDRIRLAYLSADFDQHPVSYLTAGLFDCHDKSRFATTAISIGPDSNSEMRQRLKSSFEHFIDAETQNDSQVANLVRSLEIDILIDLNGFTGDARTNIFACRPAPIQVNYLGYPGTMGASYIDYIIADEVVIPENQHRSYSEKIIFLPNSYLVNDDKRSIADRAFTRAELGLPQAGFVFCCFNNNYKITPRVFDCWMRILKQVENSVLWLSVRNATASSNLRKEALMRGIDPERLIFAERMLLLPDHLARHRLADLFLDTLPYNAHTTASDALWAGLPVLTCLGETFAGRVAASLLNAIRLPELITTTLDDYEQMAIDLAIHPEKLAAIKRKLAENRLTTPLFDTRLFTKHIEAAYVAMYERHQAGLAPDHIIIPN